MTYYSKQSEKPSIGTFYGFHHLRFYVSNAKQAASFYTSRFGFHPIAYEGLETGNSSQCTTVIKSNDIVFAFSSSLRPQDSAIASHVSMHSDGVKDIAFSVDDVRGIYTKATLREAKGIREPEILQDSYGSILIASLQTYGDTIHTLIQNILR